MSAYVLAYIATLAFIAFLLWIYPKHYRKTNKDPYESRLEIVESKLDKVLAAFSLQRR